MGDRHKYSSKYPFSGTVFCGNCGNIFKRRQWNSTRLIPFQVTNNVDPEVYNEEYKSITEELGEVRKKRLEHDKEIETKDGMKQRFDEILETIICMDSLFEGFNEEIFNALVEIWYATPRQDSEIKNCSVWG